MDKIKGKHKKEKEKKRPNNSGLVGLERRASRKRLKCIGLE
jgi:hypothetical protein